jgi:predicted acetyltransferase
MLAPVEIDGTLRMVERGEALEAFPAVYEAAVRGRPGMFARSPEWWRHRALSDPDAFRRGYTTHRRVLYLRAGRPAGYVIYRTRPDTDREGSEAQVVELVGVDVAAEKALWQFMFGIDLTSTITHWNLPVDDPLAWWLVEPRRLKRTLHDSLWVRPVDVRAALVGRGYSRAGSLKLRVRDDVCPWNEGTYRLESGDEGAARCTPCAGPAEIELSASTLGMIYLGGLRVRALARAGLITGAADCLSRAEAMFAWDPEPWCQELF